MLQSVLVVSKNKSSDNIYVHVATPGDPVYTLEKWENQYFLIL